MTPTAAPYRALKLVMRKNGFVKKKRAPADPPSILTSADDVMLPVELIGPDGCKEKPYQ